MLELVFLIVVIGILAAMIIPRMDRDNRFEAVNQVLSHIKYTQHLAMIEDMYQDWDPDTGAGSGWFKSRWEIQFFNCGGYAVHSDRGKNGGNAAQLDSAFDPQTGGRLWISSTCGAPAATDFEKMNLTRYYDLSGFTFSAGCNGQSISFDNLGRPYGTNTINGVIQANCDIQLDFNTGNSEAIRIHPETGYACILTAPGGNCL